MTGMLITAQMKKRMMMMEITAHFGGTGEEFPSCVLSESDNFAPTMKLEGVDICYLVFVFNASERILTPPFH